MYIPIRSAEHAAALSVGSPSSVSALTAQDPPAPPFSASVISCLGTFLPGLFVTNSAHTEGELLHRDLLRKRQYNGNAAHDLNVTIGIVVGVLVAAFVVGVGVFLYFFGESMQFGHKRRKAGQRKSSASSKSSQSSGSSLPPPPPPPGPPTGPPP